jgi:two-component system response regulator FixJ
MNGLGCGNGKARVVGKVESTITIFIVDDDEAVRDSFKLLLELHGMDVEDYGSTAAFAQAYRSHERECLILDQCLPGTTGLDFLTSAEGAALRLPVILMTGRGDNAIKDRALRIGVRAYLEKPVADHVLLAAIGKAIDGAAAP